MSFQSAKVTAGPDAGYSSAQGSKGLWRADCKQFSCSNLPGLLIKSKNTSGGTSSTGVAKLCFFLYSLYILSMGSLLLHWVSLRVKSLFIYFF